MVVLISDSTISHDPDDSRLPARREAQAHQSADGDAPRPQGDRLDDIGAAQEAAVDHDFRLAADRVGDLGEYVDGGAAVVELTAAVVGDVDHVNPVFDRQPGVLGGCNGLENEGHVVAVLETALYGPRSGSFRWRGARRRRDFCGTTGRGD